MDTEERTKLSWTIQNEWTPGHLGKETKISRTIRDKQNDNDVPLFGDRIDKAKHSQRVDCRPDSISNADSKWYP